MKLQRILVIGGGGFLGKTLCDIFHTSAGAEIYSLDDRQRPEAPWSQYSAEILDTLSDDFDIVYLLAACVHYGKMAGFSPSLIDTNIGLPLRVAQRFQRARLVYASSVSVYGTPLWLPMTEEHPYNRPSDYALSKLAGEVAIAAHSQQVTLRFSSLYGAGMTARTFLPLIIEQAQKTGNITLFGDGSRTQDFLHVKDAAQLLVAAGLGKGTGIYNAVNGRASSNLETAQIVAGLCPGVEIVFSGEDTTPSTAYSADRWRSHFPMIEMTDLATGLREMMHHAG